MTREQTRKLGIEFERRINEIDPRFKLQNKLTTDIIYSMLSEFQTQYIKGLYAIDDDIKSGTRKQSKIQDTTKTLVRHKILTPSKTNIDGDSNSLIFDFPSDYYSYIRSNSLVTKNYKSNEILTTAISTPNDILKQSDIKQITNSYYNKGQIIRNPIVVLESTKSDSPYLKVIHDDYTQISNLDITYYCSPYAFNVLKYNDDDLSQGAVHSYCELPYSCFEDIVSGAVDMYISQYKFKLYAGNDNQKQQQQEDES